MKTIRILVFLIMGLSSISAWSEDVKAFDPVFVTATRTPILEKFITHSYTLLDREDIALHQEESVIEILRDVPGLNIVRSGSIGANASAFIRGATPSQVLVMIDGIEINSPLVGSADLTHLLMDNIERIEVIRGSHSALFGSEAMGGVINIITHKGDEEPRGSLLGEGGSEDTFRFRGEATGLINEFRYGLSASYLDSEGSMDHDAYHNFQFSGNMGIKIGDRLDLQLVSRLIKAEKDIQDFGIITLDPNRSNETEFSLVGIKGSFEASDAWRHFFQLSWVRNEIIDKDPLNPGETGLVLRSDIESHLLTFEYQSDIELGEMNLLSAGFEYQRAKGENITVGDAFTGDFTIDEALDNFAFYVQDQFNWNDQLIVITGVRVDDHEIADTEVNPKVSAAFFIFEKTKIRASWSEGFRAPSINEILFPGFGSFDLKAEESVSWEVGIEQRLWEDRMGIDVVYFMMDFDNLIDFEVISTDPFIGRANNILEAKTSGIEFSAFIHPTDWLNIRGNYTYLDSENEMTGEVLDRRPKHSGSIGAVIHFLSSGVFAIDATFIGDRMDFGTELEGHTKVDLSLSYTIHDTWTPYVRVENVLDEDYEEASGFPGSGVLAFVGVKAEF